MPSPRPSDDEIWRKFEDDLEAYGITLRLCLAWRHWRRYQEFRYEYDDPYNCIQYNGIDDFEHTAQSGALHLILGLEEGAQGETWEEGEERDEAEEREE